MTANYTNRTKEFQQILNRWKDFYEEPLVAVIRLAMDQGVSVRDIFSVMQISKKRFYVKFGKKLGISYKNDR